MRADVYNLLYAASIGLFILPPGASAYCDTCPRDQHGRIQRSAIAKAEFKRGNPCPSTNEHRGRCPGYVMDHIIALKRGGSDVPANMQWQTVAEAKEKDRWE